MKHRDLYKKFLEELKVVQNQRRGVPSEVWVPREREFMLNLINTARSEEGRPPVAIEDVERVETFAMGHVDYTSKFALYCAELVVHTEVKP